VLVARAWVGASPVGTDGPPSSEPISPDINAAVTFTAAGTPTLEKDFNGAPVGWSVQRAF
jgi:hypothetical protein